MRQETNNEIDLLLRRMSRRDGGAAPDAGVPIETEHLDADELSSYAQNALPAAARARYTEHLADCSSCRKLVTELSLSLGATAAAHVRPIPAPGGLKKFLASLLSPMVLRYAIPALGVVLVMVVGIIVMREPNSGRFVALRQNSPQPAAVPPTEAPAQTPQAGPFNSADSARDRADDSKERQERAAKSTDVTPQSTPAAGEGAGAAAPPSATPTPAAKDEKEEVVIAQKQVEAVPAAPVTVPKFQSEEQKKLDAAAKREAKITVDGAEAEVATARA